jgi:Contractile injection system tube protein
MNRESLTQLTTAQQIASKPAYLQIVGQDKGFYAFNYNPESFGDSLTVKYSETQSAVSDQPYLDYNGSSAITRTFSGLLMDTYGELLSLRPILEGIKKLMIADLSKGKFEPPDLEFHWGSESFKPCKITNFSYTIDAWLGGEPAKGKCDLTLVSVPVFDPGKESQLTEQEQIKTAAETPPNSTADIPVLLTNRQKKEGQLLAINDIKQNVRKASPKIKQAVRSGQFNVEVDDKGNISLLSPKSEVLAIVGIYDGISFLRSLF